jgi:hypothetical protein
VIESWELWSGVRVRAVTAGREGKRGRARSVVGVCECVSEEQILNFVTQVIKCFNLSVTSVRKRMKPQFATKVLNPLLNQARAKSGVTFQPAPSLKWAIKSLMPGEHQTVCAAEMPAKIFCSFTSVST